MLTIAATHLMRFSAKASPPAFLQEAFCEGHDRRDASKRASEETQKRDAMEKPPVKIDMEQAAEVVSRTGLGRKTAPADRKTHDSLLRILICFLSISTLSHAYFKNGCMCIYIYIYI